MVRNITGFAVFAGLAVLAFKLLTAVLGSALGIIATLLWWAFLGFVIYTLLRIFSPRTADRVRNTIRNDHSAS